MSSPFWNAAYAYQSNMRAMGETTEKGEDNIERILTLEEKK